MDHPASKLSAAAVTGMIAPAIQERKDGQVVDCLEHVTDEQYLKA
jgi:hypothetical protein